MKKLIGRRPFEQGPQTVLEKGPSMILGVGGGLSSVNADAIRERRFNKADANGDGQLTQDELVKVTKRNGKGLTAESILAKADTNLDGAIDAAEDKAAFEGSASVPPTSAPPTTPPPPPNATEIAATIFEKVDGDTSGGISQDELTAALQKGGSDASAEDLFKLVDTDADGLITQTELETTLKNLFDLMKPEPTDEPVETSQTDTDSGETVTEPLLQTFTALA
jgi:Ca2+-binding EF-hand superfamily protein